jgi:hypothetical protein
MLFKWAYERMSFRFYRHGIFCSFLTQRKHSFWLREEKSLFYWCLGWTSRPNFYFGSVSVLGSVLGKGGSG